MLSCIQTQPHERYILILNRKFRSNENGFAKTKKNHMISERMKIATTAYFEPIRENSVRNIIRDSNLS